MLFRSITYIGQENHNGAPALRLTISQQFPSSLGDSASLMQHLSEANIFLDPSSFLPLAITFNTHPDGNALLDIPIELRFSDYRAVSGIQVPYHVQKFLNNGLILDFHVQTVSLNSGLTASSFTVQ